MIHAGRGVVWFSVAVFALTLTSCATPDAVSKFCASATATLETARPVFDDMKQSCLREVNSRTGFATFTPPLQENPGCEAIGKQADGASDAAQVLSDYFAAINSLASFGTAKAGTDAQTLVTNTSAAVGAGSTAQAALGSIAQFLVSAATSGYREKQLEKDLPKVSANISAVTDALVKIVEVEYAGRLLKAEERTLATRYKDYARGKPTEILLVLDARWQTDEQALEARRGSAKGLIAALRCLSKGFTDLAATTHRLKGKEVPGLLAPSVTQLQALLPQIQKAF